MVPHSDGFVWQPHALKVLVLCMWPHLSPMSWHWHKWVHLVGDVCSLAACSWLTWRIRTPVKKFLLPRQLWHLAFADGLYALSDMLHSLVRAPGDARQGYSGCCVLFWISVFSPPSPWSCTLLLAWLPCSGVRAGACASSAAQCGGAGCLVWS